MSLRIGITLVIFLTITSCRQTALLVSDPVGWMIVSRELVYKEADGTVETAYIDDQQYIHVSTQSDKIRSTHLSRQKSTVQVTWIDAEGNKRADPVIVLPREQSMLLLFRLQREALIGKPVTPENIEMILKSPKQRALRVYEGNYCGRRAFVLDFGNGRLSYCDVKTGVLLATVRQGTIDEALQKGRWELRQGNKKGIYEIICE